MAALLNQKSVPEHNINLFFLPKVQENRKKNIDKKTNIALEVDMTILKLYGQFQKEFMKNMNMT